MSVVKRYRKCADLCQRFLPPFRHIRPMRYVFGWRARALCSRGNGVRSLWAFFFEKALFSFVPFLERIGEIICPLRLGSGRCWGSEETEIMGIADGVCWWYWERSLSLVLVAADEGELLEEDVLSPTSSDPAGSALPASSQGEQELANESEEDIYEHSQPACPTYEELLEVMERATARLDIQWRHEKVGVVRSRLDERFLSGHNLPALLSFPFLPDLHSEIEKAWDKLYSACIHRCQHANYADVKGMREHGYALMPPIEGTVGSYLLAGETSTSKAPAPPSKPLKD